MTEKPELSEALDLLQRCIDYIDTTRNEADGETEPDCSVSARALLSKFNTEVADA